eukprot:762530-Hanusia_phi.AAC.3
MILIIWWSSRAFSVSISASRSSSLTFFFRFALTTCSTGWLSSRQFPQPLHLGDHPGLLCQPQALEVGAHALELLAVEVMVLSQFSLVQDVLPSLFFPVSTTPPHSHSHLQLEPCAWLTQLRPASLNNSLYKQPLREDQYPVCLQRKDNMVRGI